MILAVDLPKETLKIADVVQDLYRPSRIRTSSLSNSSLPSLVAECVHDVAASSFHSTVMTSLALRVIITLSPDDVRLADRMISIESLHLIPAVNR